MSILFYRRPDYHERSTVPINASECARYVERSKKSERSIPAGLSFEDIVNNKALPPCSLSDFMDYLVYVEHNAENLQFYLWYHSYVERFNALPEYQQRLSAPWVADKRDATQQQPKVKKDTLNEMLHGYDARESDLFDSDVMVKGRPMSIIKDEASSMAPTVTSVAETNSGVGLKWQPFTIQPFRDEINRVIRHYLAFSGPRELNLSHRDRALCLHALQHTTHPSAFFPAITIAESALRGQSHPNFIRWSICNGNRPRVIMVRTNCIMTIIMGTALAVALILSRYSRWYRLTAGVLWFIGISGLIAAYKGLCVILHHSHARMLKPWEEELSGDEMDELDGERPRTSSVTESTRELSLSMQQTNTDKATFSSTATSFKKNWLSPFGPRNSGYGEESWTARERQKSVWRKLFGKNVWTQDETLRVLQDRIVMGANLWGALSTVILCAIAVSIPEIGLF